MLGRLLKRAQDDGSLRRDFSLAEFCALAVGTVCATDRIRLLTDCRTAFGHHDAMPTAVLIDRLKADPEAPWAEYGGTGLNAMVLGKLLREYDITSRNVRFPQPIGQVKGFQRADFADAWRRYCPDADGESSQPSLPSSTLGRLNNVVRLKPSQPAFDEMPPPPADTAIGTG
jgi:hypothetical protein